jgi:hypothetical protein
MSVFRTIETSRTSGLTRYLQCPWCTERNQRPTQRLHRYQQKWGWLTLSRWWECSVCGHRLPDRSGRINDKHSKS